jgi:hypothetical protein
VILESKEKGRPCNDANQVAIPPEKILTTDEKIILKRISISLGPLTCFVVLKLEFLFKFSI